MAEALQAPYRLIEIARKLPLRQAASTSFLRTNARCGQNVIMPIQAGALRRQKPFSRANRSR